MRTTRAHGRIALATVLAAMLFAGGTALANDPPMEGNEAGESRQPMDDTWITTKVKASLLAETDVSGLKIDVETTNGVVTLSGDVENATQIEKARSVAAGIEGVGEVDTAGLKVGTTESP